MDNDRLKKQIQFIVEIDKLKRVLRQTILTDRSRRENSAEHSWHIAVMALLLAEYAKDKGIDLFRVLKILLVHDLVEIDAGDTYCYDDERAEEKAAKEQKAADRVFNILPDDQAEEFRDLWDEYEAQNTPESQFAGALDRLQPLIHNYATDGEMWKKNGIKSHQVILKTQPIEDGAPFLWQYARSFIDAAIERGLFSK
jgi:putative hydrolase of HD superfamily